MDLRKELDPLIIAWISGVSRGKIKDGYYCGDEEERVERAAQILLDSKLYIVDDPRFTTTSIVSTIKEYKNIHSICLKFHNRVMVTCRPARSCARSG